MDAPVVGRLPGGGEDIDTADSRERRRGSGSFLGAEESDEEISFRGSGSLRDRLGETSLVIPGFTAELTTDICRFRRIPET